MLLEKYAKGEERDADAIFSRVARALAAAEKDPKHWEKKFLHALQDGFIPAGRIMSAAGAGIRAGPDDPEPVGRHDRSAGQREGRQKWLRDVTRSPLAGCSANGRQRERCRTTTSLT